MKNILRGILILMVIVVVRPTQAQHEPPTPTEFTYTIESRQTNRMAEKCGYTPASIGVTNCCEQITRFYRRLDTDVIWDVDFGGGKSGYATYHLIDEFINCEPVHSGTGHYDVSDIGADRTLSGDLTSTGWNISTSDGIDYSAWICSGWVIKTNTGTIDTCTGFNDWDFAGHYSRNCHVPHNSHSLPFPWVYEITSTCVSKHANAVFTGEDSSGEHTRTETLSSEFTTAELIASVMCDPSGEWVPTGGESYHSKADISSDESWAQVNKAEARFKVWAPEDEEFTIPYVEYRTLYTNGETIIVETEQEITGTGTGDWQYFPVGIPVAFSVEDDEDCPKYHGEEAWIAAGCGSGGGSCSAGSCGDGPGTVHARNSSVHIAMGLGATSYGEGKASLVLASKSPGAHITTPAGMQLFGDLRGAETVRSGGVLQQVKTPLCLADITANSATSVSVKFYEAGSFGGSAPYDTSGETPFSICTIEQVGSTNHIRVTVSNDGTTIYDYTWSDADKGWTLSSGGGIRKETRAKTESPRVRTHTIKNASNTTVFQDVKRYVTLGSKQLLAQQETGSPGAGLTNRWFYYDNAATDGAGFGKIKMTIEPSGFWKRFQYDHTGRLTNEVSKFLNAATNAAENVCRVTRYNFSSLDGTNEFETRIELLQGVEVSREYTAKFPGVTHHIRCVAPGAAWNNSANLVTRTYVYGSGTFAGKPYKTISPDGTMQLHTYQDAGNRITTVYSGQPNGDFTAVTNGSKTVTYIDEAGRVQSRYTYDIVLGDNYPIDYEGYSYDNLGRLTTSYHTDGATTSINYDCCGVESTVDRDGVTTTHIHDALHREVGALRNGVMVTNLLDAAGNVLATVRVGSDGTTNLLRRASYDTAGRLLYETNALGGVTSYAQTFDGSGQTVLTTTFPDNGQRVETRYQDGSVKSVTGSAAFPVYYDYGAYSNGSYTKETKGSSSGSEWMKSYSDMLGRSWKTEYADGAASTNFYNIKGQMEKSVDPDGVTRLYTYNGLGQTDKTILDMDRNGTGTDAVDRITRSTNDVVLNDLGAVTRRSRVYQTADNGSEILTGERLMIPALNKSISLSFGLGTTNVTSYTPASQQRTVTTTHPDSSQTVSLYTNGLLARVTRSDSSYNPLPTIHYAYDSHGRQSQQIDARNGATTYYHNTADQISGVVTPAPAAGQNPQVTTNYFDTSGRVWKTTLPDGTSVTNEFYVTGQLKKNTGSRVYPAQYTQDGQGRSQTLTTWQNFAGNSGSAVTTWNYDSQRGLLASKRYANNTGPNYTNTPAGRLKNRLWARNLNTTYAYNNAGDLNNVSYTDGTSSVATGFDRRGRATAVTNGATVTASSLSDAGLLLAESYAGGPFNGVSVTNGYDQFLRRTNLSFLSASSQNLSATSYGYDSASRLQSVTALDSGLSPLVSAGYSYLADSALIGEIYYTNGGTLCMTRSNQFDNLNRLTNLVWNVGGSNVASFAYQYNSANQRTRVTLVDGSYWLYLYDALGQVTSAKRYWNDGTLVAGQQSTFTFDDIGNRKVTMSGGDQSGANLRSANYAANTLNQITSRDVPGYVNILGTATNTATVSLWSKESTALYTPTYRKGEYFRGEMPLNNSTGAVWLTITNIAVLSNYTGADVVTNTIGKLFVPKTAETFSYDLDGNLTNDGRWSYIWDAENRITSFTRSSAAPIGSRVKLDCQYDSKSRRTQKIVSTWNGSSYVAQSTNKFVYDGWNLVAILDATNGLVQSFQWGTDASGTMQGAGGVGGLISMTVHQGTNAGTYFYCFDGNYNVATLVNVTNGAIEAVYDYNAFLGILRATGRLAFVNPFVSSTKFCDWESGFLYYGYRYYDPDTGRWPSRDPIGERGGKNLFSFVGNDAENSYDYLGQRMEPNPRPPTPPRQPPNTDPVPSGQCRIQVCCGSVSGTVWEHCYVGFGDENGTSGCRAGPSRRTQGSGSSGSQGGVPSHCNKCCGFWGTLSGGCGTPGSPEMAGDFGQSGQNCVTVEQSAAACGVVDCVRRKIQDMNQQCIRYRVFGPNSNTAIYTALQECMGTSPTSPAGSQIPGWRPINDDDKRCN